MTPDLIAACDRIAALAEKTTVAAWSAVPQTDGSSMIAHEYPTGNQMRPKGLRLIAQVMARGNSLEQDTANAAFIAAAPDMAALIAKLKAELQNSVPKAHPQVLVERMRWEPEHIGQMGTDLFGTAAALKDSAEQCERLLAGETPPPVGTEWTNKEEGK